MLLYLGIICLALWLISRKGMLQFSQRSDDDRQRMREEELQWAKETDEKLAIMAASHPPEAPKQPTTIHQHIHIHQHKEQILQVNDLHIHK